MADIILKDKHGADVPYTDVDAVSFATPDGGVAVFTQGGGTITEEEIIEVIEKYNEDNPLQIDNTLKKTNGVLGVNSASSVQQNNNLPVTSGAVYAQISSIEQYISEVSDATQKNGSDITLMNNVIQTVNEVAEQALDTARAASPRVVNETLIFGRTINA